MRAGGIVHYSINGYDVIKLYHKPDVTQPQTHVNVYTTVHTHRQSTVHTQRQSTVHHFVHTVYFFAFLLEIVGLPAHSVHCGKNSGGVSFTSMSLEQWTQMSV